MSHHKSNKHRHPQIVLDEKPDELLEAEEAASIHARTRPGTLAVNQMTVRAFTFGRDRYAVSGEGYRTEGEIARASGGKLPDLMSLLVPAVLCNDSEIRDGQLIGDPTRRCTAGSCPEGRHGCGGDSSVKPADHR